MATRSLIGRQLEDDYIEYIYCHWDGDPRTNGKTLFNYYNSSERVQELLKLGDLSILQKEIGEQHDFRGKDHPDWCVAYHRDRDDPWKNTKARKIYLESYYLGRALKSSCDFVYLYRNNEWLWMPRIKIKPYSEGQFSSLKDLFQEGGTENAQENV